MSYGLNRNKIIALIVLIALPVTGAAWYFVRNDADSRGRQLRQKLQDALVAFEREDYDTALIELDKLNPNGELRGPILFLKGESLRRQGRLAESERILQQLVSEQPDHAEAHRRLAAIYYDLGVNAAAIAELQFLARLKPDDFSPHHLLGQMSFDFEQYSEAADHFRKALDLHPPADKRLSLVRSLGQALVRNRQYQDALEVLEDDTEDALALALKSECYWSLGQQDAAQEALKQAQLLDADEVTVLLLQARIKIDEGKFDQALELLEKLLAKDRHNVQARYQLALAYRALGNNEAYESQMAQMKHSQEMKGQLTALSLEAIQQPFDAEIRLEIAELCEKLDKPKLAETWRRAAEECRKASGYYLGGESKR